MSVMPTTQPLRPIDGPLVSNGHVLDRTPQRLGPLAETPAEERRDRQALLGRLARQGYLLLRGAADPAMIRAFREFYFSRLQYTGLLSGDAPVADGVDSGARSTCRS